MHGRSQRPGLYRVKNRTAISPHPTLSPGGEGIGELPLKAAGSRHHILLMHGRRHELQAVPPNYLLIVIGVRPKCMERVVRADRESGVVANEATAEMIAGVDWMSGD